MGEGGDREKERERGGGINWIHFFPQRNVLQEDIGNILVEMR